MSETVLQQWLDDEVRCRAQQSHPGTIEKDIMKEMTGLEYLQGIAQGKFPFAPMGKTLDFFPVEVEYGRVVFQGTPQLEFYNPIGSVHGGYFCTLLDSAVACAVHSTLPKGVGYTTLEIKVNLTRAMTTATGPIRAEGKVIQVGRQIGIAEGNIVDVAGKIYGHATTTCLIFPIP